MDLPARLGLERLAQLRKTWVQVERGAISRITGKARPALPAEDLHLIRQQVDECLSEARGVLPLRGPGLRVWAGFTWI